MLKITTSNDNSIQLENKSKTKSLAIMCSEIKKFNQYCKESADDLNQIPVQSLSDDTISDADMENLLRWLEFRNELNNWVGIGYDSAGRNTESLSTELAGDEVWYSAKNKSETILFWFREFEYKLFEENNKTSITFDDRDCNGSFIITDPEMNHFLMYFKSLNKLELLKND